MDFIIVYERLNREYQNAVLLKVELERRGYSCLITQYYQAENFFKTYLGENHIILVPNMYIGKNIYRTVSRFGKPKCIVNLQYEQVLSEKWEKLGHHNPRGDAKYCQHICWGKKTENRLIESGVPSANVHTLGAIQLDLLRQEFREPRDVLRNRACKRYGFPVDGKVSLFLSSFTYADITPSRLLMNENAAGVKLDSFVDIHTKSRCEVVDWLEKYLNDFPDTKLIYRPHPDELSLDIVKDLENRYENFVICSEGAAKEWIEISDFVISWYSTTVVETHLLDIPYVILRPFTLPQDFDSVLLKKGMFVKSYSELKKINSEVYSGANVKSLKDQDIFDYYEISDNKPAYIRYADFLVDLKCSHSEFLFDYSLPKLLSARVNTFFVSIVYLLYKIMTTLFGSNFYKNKKGWFYSWMNEFNNQIRTEDYEIISTEYIKGKFNVR